MIVYRVAIVLHASIEPEWVDWMTKVHVPDVLRTGCFSDCRMYKLLGPENEGPAYVMQYHCPSLEEYHRYRDNFAPGLQKEHTERFAGRFHGSRQLLEEIARIHPG